METKDHWPNGHQDVRRNGTGAGESTFSNIYIYRDDVGGVSGVNEPAATSIGRKQWTVHIIWKSFRALPKYKSILLGNLKWTVSCLILLLIQCKIIKLIMKIVSYLIVCAVTFLNCFALIKWNLFLIHLLWNVSEIHIHDVAVHETN